MLPEVVASAAPPSLRQTPPPVLSACGVSRSFFGNPVLRDVSMELVPGRIHALLGENGAGKSTLINILSGALRPDSGHLLVDGTTVAALTPAQARRHGIAVVQQELSLSPHLAIAENLALGAAPTRRGLVNYGELAARAVEACRAVGLELPLERPVGQLPLGQRQLVEIAKALFRGPRILILDEPSSSLPARDVALLMALIRSLRDQGVAILYISHRLHEVLDLCDHVTVLKDGAVTADRPLAGIDPDGLVRLMVGREHGGLFPPFVSSARAEPALTVTGFHAGQMQGLDLDLRQGEILGVGGLVGQGQEDLLLGLYGALPAAATTASLLGRRGLPRSVAEATDRGVVYVPADRKHEALLLPHAIRFNLLLPSLTKLAGWLRRYRAEAKNAAELADRLAIRGDLRRPVRTLSGGNQQKVALAKFLPLAPRILLLNDPTRGVDVATKREIYEALQALAAAGAAVILVTSDTPELVHLCDRVLVVRDGRQAALLPHGAATEAAIVRAALGVDMAAGEAARAPGAATPAVGEAA